MVAKQKNGDIVWLEKGNSNAGLNHIIKRHEKDYKKALGIDKSQIPAHIKEVVENGTIVLNREKNNDFERIYDYGGKYYAVSGIGKMDI